MAQYQELSLMNVDNEILGSLELLNQVLCCV